jgi:tryptophan synthase alpha chain
MSRIAKIFNHLETNQKKAFIPFITAGDGGIDLTLEIMLNLSNCGADIIEIGVPFSDPMADGPIIAKSHQRAINNDTNIKDVLDLVTKFRKKNNKTAIVLMSYLNIIEVFGYKNLAIEAEKSGVDGILVIDMPVEEANDLKIELANKKIDLIFLISTNTIKKRIKHLEKLASGFVYLISLKGVTGSNTIDINDVNLCLEKIKSLITLPVCVGFGVKNAESAKLIAQKANGVIVGSSLVEFIEKYKNDRKKILSAINNLAKDIREAI